MSLLPTTRINSSLSQNNGGGGSSSSVEPGIPDEDILLVDFQPTSQILSSPSTTNSTTMYPIPPPVGQLPSAHIVSLNHHPSVSSDGVTTPISATGSSGKANNPNNFSLVNLSNHVQHNNGNREGSDLTYPTQFHHPQLSNPSNPTFNDSIPQADDIPYDEDDEYVRHQAMAHPSLLTNKRRSRRFNRENHNHAWESANHFGYHPQQHQPMSSSLSSSEDSDTGFLMGTRKTAFARRSVQRGLDPPLNPVGGGNLSPSATTGLLPNLGSRKRVRRKRPSARNRKPVNNQRDKIPNPSDVLSLCCCLCQDDSQRSHRTSARSIRNRYLRLTFFIVVIIVVIVLTSITLSLQRKVDSLDLSLKKLNEAIGSPSDTSGGSGTSNHVQSLDSLVSSQNVLNSTVVGLKTQLDQMLSLIHELQTKVDAAASKPDGVTEVRGEVAKLGSWVGDLSETIKNVQGDVEKLKNESKNPVHDSITSPSGGSKESQPAKSK